MTATMTMPTDRGSILQLSQPDPEFLQFLQSLASMPMPENVSDPDVARQFRQTEDRRRRDALPSFPLVSETTKLVPMRDGSTNEARIFTPTSPAPSTGRPLVVLAYGGGFITGDNDSATPSSLPIASAYNTVVVNISYRPAPAFKFPTQGNDVWDALTWLVSKASSLGADVDAGLILGGESAGGNVAAVAAVKAVTEGLPLGAKLTGLWLSVPWLLEDVPEGYKDAYLAREQNGGAALVDNGLLEMVKGIWLPEISSPEFSPFNSLDRVNEKHPPTYIQVCGLDPLRDDGIIYERVLREKGIKTQIDAYPGVPHAHWAMCPHIKSAQKAMVDSVLGVGWLLGKTAAIEDIKKSLGKLAADV